MNAFQCKTPGCGRDKQLNGWIWCDKCEKTKIVTNTVWQAKLCAKKKNRSIRLVFTHNDNHMMIVWPFKKSEVSAADFEFMYVEMCKYLEEHNNQLRFRLVKTCTNCTYFRALDEFEDLILGFRKRFKLNNKKDLTLDDPRHEHLKEIEVWDEEHPIFFHTHSRRENQKEGTTTEEDERWFDALWSARNSVITVEIKED